MSLVSKNLNVDKNLFNQIDSSIDTKDFKMILLGRVAIHIATIENFNLIPLSDGKNISNFIN